MTRTTCFEYFIGVNDDMSHVLFAFCEHFIGIFICTVGSLGPRMSRALMHASLILEYAALRFYRHEMWMRIDCW